MKYGLGLYGLLLLGGCAAEHIIGSAGLLAAETYPGLSSGPAALAAVAVGDFDGDGRQDVALLDGTAAELCFFAGKGDGTLLSPRCQTMAALRAEGLLLAVRHRERRAADLIAGGPSLLVLSGVGDGSFSISDTIFPTGGILAMVATASERDAALAVLTAEGGSGEGGGTVSDWPLAPSGRLGTPTRYAFAAPQHALLYADLDGEGRNELAALSPHAVTVYGARGAARVTQCAETSLGVSYGAPMAMGALDLDGDGQLELLVADAVRRGLVAFGGSSEQGFFCASDAVRFPLEQPSHLLGGDLDGDGAQDLLAFGSSRNGQGEVVLIRGAPVGSGRQAALSRYALFEPAAAGALGDA